MDHKRIPRDSILREEANTAPGSKALGVSMFWFAVDANPHATDGAWAADAFHYFVVLKRGGRVFTTYYSMGSAHKSYHDGQWHADPPEIRDLLSGLSADCQGADQSFDDWCADLGFDTDSAKARRTYDTVRQQAEQLAEFFSASDTLPGAWEKFIEFANA